MTELSPAQKALAAFNERHELCGPFDDDWVEQCLAAALEAVVAKTKQRQYGTCWICDANELLAIAAELRGTTTNQEG